MAKFAQGKFYPKNPEKYIGKNTPMFRSGWEWQMMQFLDKSEHVVSWASEAIVIQYMHPFKKKITSYIPDFYVKYRDKNSQMHAELLEVKPASQTFLADSKKRADQIQYVINQAKWQAARAYCAKANMTFRILTQQNIFRE